MKHVYLIKNSEENTYKIGVGKNPRRRLAQLQTGNSSELLLIDAYSTEFAYKIEKVFHKRYSHFKKEGEWFSLSLIEELKFREDCKKIEEGIIILRENGNVFV